MVKIGSNARIIIPPNVVIQQENLKDDHAIVIIRSVFESFINFDPYLKIFYIYIYVLG